jgi:hypothetical protein
METDSDTEQMACSEKVFSHRRTPLEWITEISTHQESNPLPVGCSTVDLNRSNSRKSPSRCSDHMHRNCIVWSSIEPAPGGVLGRERLETSLTSKLPVGGVRFHWSIPTRLLRVLGLATSLTSKLSLRPKELFNLGCTRLTDTFAVVHIER